MEGSSLLDLIGSNMDHSDDNADGPPSLLSGEDDDDWSRKVETDEPPSVPDESVIEQSADGRNHHHHHHNDGSFGAPPHSMSDEDMERDVNRMPLLRPSQRELTMKEKLVLRERERRIETERARLKRQFALNNNQMADEQAARGLDGATGIYDPTAANATESVATLGEESTMVHPDEESAEHPTLPVTMERFLRNSDGFDPQIESTRQNVGGGSDNAEVAGGGGVLMGRLIQDLMLLENEQLNIQSSTATTDHHLSSGNNVQRSVSFEVERSAHHELHDALGASLIAAGDASMQANPSVQLDTEDEGANAMDSSADASIASSDDTPTAQHEGPSGGLQEEPRVLRLTEADMQEMAATEEESIANYPPSERDDNLSEVGELADFAITNPVFTRGDFSQDTPTTAVESTASVGHGSEKPSAVSSDRHSDYGATSANDTVEAQPPSERDFLSPILDVQSQRVVEVTEEMKIGTSRRAERGDDGTRDDEPEIVNRRIRPGMIAGLRTTVVSSNGAPSSPGEAGRLNQAVSVDGFDFDKDAPRSPGSADLNDSFQNLPGDQTFSPKMQVSPITSKKNSNGVVGSLMEYGAMEEGQLGSRGARAMLSATVGETAPLLSDVPPEIITRREKTNGKGFVSIKHSIQGRLNSVFSDVRSEEDEDKQEVHNQSYQYMHSSAWERAAPERLFALTITLILEIPVLLMISGGSDALCGLVGRRRYQLFVSFIPLTSAISGNVGLQASTLTTRAISHEHVTAAAYRAWFAMEVGAACFLGLGMGFLLGTIAYYASEMDYAFGLTIFIAQFVSIVTAGLTGTIAPLLFSFIFKRDSGKWGGPLETAIQDIVGSFAMVIMSYHLLRFLGPGPIQPDDYCGVPSDATIQQQP